MDLVGTCPMKEWDDWLEEGDCAGTPDTGTPYYWQTRSRLARRINPGDRFYVVAHGRLRGYAEVVRVEAFPDEPDRGYGRGKTGYSYTIVRRGGAVAVTIRDPIPRLPGPPQAVVEPGGRTPVPGLEDTVNGRHGGLDCRQHRRSLNPLGSPGPPSLPQDLPLLWKEGVAVGPAQREVEAVRGRRAARLSREPSAFRGRRGGSKWLTVGHLRGCFPAFSGKTLDFRAVDR